MLPEASAETSMFKRDFFSSGVADHALRLGPYMRISNYQENFSMDTGGRMRIDKS